MASRARVDLAKTHRTTTKKIIWGNKATTKGKAGNAALPFKKNNDPATKRVVQIKIASSWPT